MTTAQFFRQLTGAMALAVLLTLLLWLVPAVRPHLALSGLSLLGFVLLSIAMFFVGRAAAASQDRYAFSRMVLVFTLMKMVVAVVVVLIYTSWAQPDNKLFILPFFVVYLIFTIFETHFLMRLGKMYT